jgi:hypothetical protein
MIEQAKPSDAEHTQKRLSVNGLRWLIAITSIALVVWGGLAFVVQPWGPSSAWEAADHNRDGILTRDEMSLFVTQKPHRTDRLLMHFDAADVDKDGVVTLVESSKYGNEIGSKDPFLRDAKK